MCMSVMFLSHFRFVFLQCRSRCVNQISGLCSCSDVYVSDMSVQFRICVFVVMCMFVATERVTLLFAFARVTAGL